MEPRHLPEALAFGCASGRKDFFAQSERDQGHSSFDQTPCGAVIHSHPCAFITCPGSVSA